jgi:hypothetical protein
MVSIYQSECVGGIDGFECRHRSSNFMPVLSSGMRRYFGWHSHTWDLVIFLKLGGVDGGSIAIIIMSMPRVELSWWRCCRYYVDCWSPDCLYFELCLSCSRHTYARGRPPVFTNEANISHACICPSSSGTRFALENKSSQRRHLLWFFGCASELSKIQIV